MPPLILALMGGRPRPRRTRDRCGPWIAAAPGPAVKVRSAPLTNVRGSVDSSRYRTATVREPVLPQAAKADEGVSATMNAGHWVPVVQAYNLLIVLYTPFPLTHPLASGILGKSCRLNRCLPLRECRFRSVGGSWEWESLDNRIVHAFDGCSTRSHRFLV